MRQKEELLKKFEAFQHSKSHDRFGDLLNLNNIFDFFWNEIEAMDREISIINKMKDVAIDNSGKYYSEVDQCEAKISHLQDTLEAADNVIKIFERPYEYNELQVRTILEKYQKLKTKSQS